jgi:hypothetical protein
MVLQHALEEGVVLVQNGEVILFEGLVEFGQGEGGFEGVFEAIDVLEVAEVEEDGLEAAARVVLQHAGDVPG